mmetsp:Transcript_45205/g.144029  ORF Transcript_45205/g.144029 Transcript_45205/m.144029 type:complete len:208 (-) Transcript_45205:228-851(-)
MRSQSTAFSKSTPLIGRYVVGPAPSAGPWYEKAPAWLLSAQTVAKSEKYSNLSNHSTTCFSSAFVQRSSTRKARTETWRSRTSSSKPLWNMSAMPAAPRSTRRKSTCRLRSSFLQTSSKGRTGARYSSGSGCAIRSRTRQQGCPGSSASAPTAPSAQERRTSSAAGALPPPARSKDTGRSLPFERPSGASAARTVATRTRPSAASAA